MSKNEKVYQADSVSVAILKKKPPILEIKCMGMANTSGWNGAELQPYIYVNPPADGIYEFDFIADPPGPGEVVLDVLTPINAEYSWENFPAELKGVRIYSATNSKEALLS